jgi:hypothetical protein
LTPEVIVGEDLIVFHLLFLVGFVLLSSFLGKFAEVLYSLSARGAHRNLVESLLQKLAKTVIVPDMQDFHDIYDGEPPSGEQKDRPSESVHGAD